MSQRIPIVDALMNSATLALNMALLPVSIAMVLIVLFGGWVFRRFMASKGQIVWRKIQESEAKIAQSA